MAKQKGPAILPHYENEQDEKRSVIYWLTVSFTILFLFIAPFQKALFNGYAVPFERPIYSSILLSSLILFSMSLYFFYNWRLREWRDVLGILIWLLPLSFLISVIPAASRHNAINMVYIQSMYAIFFLIGLYFARNKLGSGLIQWGIMGSGYLLVLYGAANMFGNTYYQDAVMLTENGMRLTSVFQYANAYASYLIGLLLASLFLLTISRKWYIQLLHGTMSMIILLSFLLTLSRGGLVLLPVILLLVFPFLSVTRQILIFIYIGISLIASLAVSGKIITIATDIAKQIQPTAKPNGTSQVPGLTSQSLLGWALLLSAALITGAIFVVAQKFAAPYLQKRLARFSERKFAPFILPAALVVLGSLGIFLILGDTGFKQLLPQTLQSRINSINFEQHSVLERQTFYKDSLKLLKDYPIFGAGGGAWASLYEKYQNNPYTSRQTHSFFLQYLIESGVVGLLILLCLMGTVLYLFIRHFIREKGEERQQNLTLYMIAVSLLVHSAIDFEMSYVYLSALVFLCLGGIASRASGRQIREIPFDEGAGWRFTYPAFISGLSVFLFVVSLIALNANSYYFSALNIAENKRPLDEILVPLNSAINLQPSHPNFLATKMDFLQQVYEQTKNEKYYNDLKNLAVTAQQKEPNDRTILQGNIKALLIKGQNEQALTELNRAIALSPWELRYYERAIEQNLLLGSNARDAGNNEVRDRYWNDALNLYTTVEQKTEDLKKLPKGQGQGKPFYVTPFIYSCVGQISYMKSDFTNAAAMLKKSLAVAEPKLDDPNTRVTIRWYLAALRIQGQDDPQLYSQLISKDMKEKIEIEKLLGTVEQKK